MIYGVWKTEANRFAYDIDKWGKQAYFTDDINQAHAYCETLSIGWPNNSYIVKEYQEKQS